MKNYAAEEHFVAAAATTPRFRDLSTNEVQPCLQPPIGTWLPVRTPVLVPAISTLEKSKPGNLLTKILK